jgi:hypothetical protein
MNENFVVYSDGNDYAVYLVDSPYLVYANIETNFIYSFAFDPYNDLLIVNKPGNLNTI